MKKILMLLCLTLCVGVANANGTNNSASSSSSSSSSAGGSSANNPLGLARGTLELRSIILSSCSFSTSQAPLSLTEIETALSPYSSLSIQRFDAAVKRVVEELTNLRGAEDTEGRVRERGLCV